MFDKDVENVCSYPKYFALFLSYEYVWFLFGYKPDCEYAFSRTVGSSHAYKAVDNRLIFVTIR